MNEVLKAIEERRSYRMFKQEQIDRQTLQQILDAAVYSPSGMGLQSPEIVVLQNPEDIRRLERLNAEVIGKPDEKVFYGAPTVAVVFADSQISTYIEDGSLVIGTMMLAAHSLGIASCWVHRAREEFESEEGKKLKKSWGIDEKYVGIGHCILGYPEGERPLPKERRKDMVHIL